MFHIIKAFNIMALEIKGMTRSFTFKKGNGMVTLDDPNTSDSPEMVMNYYSNFYPSSRKTRRCMNSKLPSGQKDKSNGKGQ